MSIYISSNIFFMITIWILLGVIVNGIFVGRLIWKWRKHPEDEVLFGSSTEVGGVPFTKDVARQVFQHVLFGHDSSQMTLVFLLLSAYILYRIIAWPIALYGMIAGGKDQDPPDDGDSEESTDKLVPVPQS